MEKNCFFYTWLHYLSIYSNSIEEGKSVKEIINAESEILHDETQKILAEIQPMLVAYDDLPVIMSGDFNSGSHLDWINRIKEIHILVIPYILRLYHFG